MLVSFLFQNDLVVRGCVLVRRAVNPDPVRSYLKYIYPQNDSGMDLFAEQRDLTLAGCFLLCRCSIVSLATACRPVSGKPRASQARQFP